MKVRHLIPSSYLIQMFASLLNFFTTKKVQDEQEYVRMTYRNNIKQVLPTTFYDSDSGWGCMLRVTQMAVANLLFKRQAAKLDNIASLFWDNSEMPFSLQTLTSISKQLYPNKKQFEWYSPCEAGFILKRALENFNLTYNVAVCNDNSIFLDEISTEKENIVILVMSRIGLDKAEKDYLGTVTEIMQLKHFFAILGGTPRYAHLFLKHKNDYLGYLDPHETRRCPEELEEMLSSAGEQLAKLEWVRKDKISSSMCLMFVCVKEELGTLWSELKMMRDRLGDKFFLYLQESRPQMSSEDGIIEIIDLEELTQ